MSQFGEKTQERFSNLQENNLRLELLTASQNKVVKILQEGYAKLRKASEETKKRLNQVLEEQHHCKRDRECLDQEIKKLFNVFQKTKPQPQGFFFHNPYHQENIKPDALLENKARSPSQFQDRNNMTYSEKEVLKQLPEASSWPKFSVVGEYYHMELNDYIDGLFIDVPSISDY
ncbi:hypothetical protein O181_031216 [Austropuccinia psidii MF-1]|uniref:Uncharacterized protein n=1 Tax=Austropuccinia psidii MF-1 TaxID=1389203 RepID=A0A9Q3H4Z4_9BASI|nr:hypothetical protein [Austropuccinia psidii MF-1]